MVVVVRFPLGFVLALAVEIRAARAARDGRQRYAHPPERRAAGDQHPNEYGERPGDQRHHRNQYWTVAHEKSLPKLARGRCCSSFRLATELSQIGRASCRERV